MKIFGHLVLSLFAVCAFGETSFAEKRGVAESLMAEGKFEAAHEAFAELVFSGARDSATRSLAADINAACEALRRMERSARVVPFCHNVAAAFPEVPEAVVAVANNYLWAYHCGYMEDGVFVYGGHDRWHVNERLSSLERDRVYMLRTLLALRPHVEARGEETLTRSYLSVLADVLRWDEPYTIYWNEPYRDSRYAYNVRKDALNRLTELGDSATPPEYERINFTSLNDSFYPIEVKLFRFYPDAASFFDVPASWEAARNDGERWRWVVEEMRRKGFDDLAADHVYDFAQTMCGLRNVTMVMSEAYGFGFYDAEVLAVNETFFFSKEKHECERMVLPEAYDYVAIAKRRIAALEAALGDVPKEALAADVRFATYANYVRELGAEYEARRKFDRAAALYKRAETFLGQEAQTRWRAITEPVICLGDLNVVTNGAEAVERFEVHHRDTTNIHVAVSRCDIASVFADDEKLGDFLWGLNAAPRLLRESGAKRVAARDVAVTNLPNHRLNTSTIDFPRALETGAYLMDVSAKDSADLRIVYILDLAFVANETEEELYGSNFSDEITVVNSATGEVVPDDTRVKVLFVKFPETMRTDPKDWTKQIADVQLQDGKFRLTEVIRQMEGEEVFEKDFSSSPAIGMARHYGPGIYVVAFTESGSFGFDALKGWRNCENSILPDNRTHRSAWGGIDPYEGKNIHSFRRYRSRHRVVNAYDWNR